MKLSKFISYFFHPINFPILGALLYFLFLPKYIFKPQEYTILIVVFIGSYIFPVLFLYAMKRFGMINSYHMVSIEERKFPTLLFIAISYIVGNWLYKASIVDLLALLFFGYGIGLIFSYIFLYFKIKISLHTSAISGLIGFLIYFSYHYKINILIILAVLFILSGLISSARLNLKAHKLNEVLLGFLVGVSTQFMAYCIYIM
jgi:hypothetical protein